MSGLIQMDEYLKVARENDDLKERLTLAQEDAAARADESLVLSLQHVTGTTHTQAKILAAMWASFPLAASLSTLRSLVGAQEDEWLAEQNMKVQIYKTRRRLEQAGVFAAILNVKGAGYRLSAELFDWLQARLEPAQRKQGRG